MHVNPLGLTQPTVLSVSRLLRELITFGTTPGAYRKDLARVA